MNENNVTSLRDMLAQLPTEQLDEMLRAELKKTPTDANAVRMIMDILRQREMDESGEMTAEEEAAWAEYQASAPEKPRRAKLPGWVLRAASVVLVVGLLFAVVPKEAKAGSIFDVLASWTNDFLEFLSPGGESMQLDYEFKTDHPGLQQLHDTVVEYGVTGPAVPMWIPEEYDTLVSLDVERIGVQTIISAGFSNGTKELVIRIDVYDTSKPREYYKNLQSPKLLELYGTAHHYVKNMDRYTAVWERDNIEGSITIDCQEDTLQKILKSIYVMEAI